MCISKHHILMVSCVCSVFPTQWMNCCESKTKFIFIHSYYIYFFIMAGKLLFCDQELFFCVFSFSTWLICVCHSLFAINGLTNWVMRERLRGSEFFAPSHVNRDSCLTNPWLLESLHVWQLLDLIQMPSHTIFYCVCSV
jgi:hypothetical protein